MKALRTVGVPYTDDEIIIEDIERLGKIPAVLLQHGDRNLDSDRAYIIACKTILGRICAVAFRTESAKVESTGKINEERIIGWSAIHYLTGGCSVHSTLDERIIGSCGKADSAMDGTRTDVRRSANATGDISKKATSDTPLHDVAGPLVPLRSGTGITNIEERGLVFVDRGEREAVGYIITGRRAIVLDVDLIADVASECIIVRTTFRQLERDIVGDDGYCIGIIRRTKCVQICIVSLWVLSDQRSLAVR